MWIPCSEPARSLHWPTFSALAVSAKAGPNLSSSCALSHPRSPIMPPPFCAVVHSENSLHTDKYFGVGWSAASFALEASAGSFIVLASWVSSRSALRRISSASSRVREMGLFLTGSNGWPQSRCFTTMCRRRTLSASFRAFFAAGGPALSSFGVKYMTTTVHCGVTPWDAQASAAFPAISPLAARGLPRNSAPMATASAGLTASATGAECITRNWCLIAQESSVTAV
mmetsp:Transcript_55040/g.119996  ORF Transcript_55040/g.119996 Transcript_55040/m.119996 type:complete len:227 (-) Transcript_55040:972-1652(-)